MYSPLVGCHCLLLSSFLSCKIRTKITKVPYRLSSSALLVQLPRILNITLKSCSFLHSTLSHDCPRPSMLISINYMSLIVRFTVIWWCTMVVVYVMTMETMKKEAQTDGDGYEVQPSYSPIPTARWIEYVLLCYITISLILNPYLRHLQHLRYNNSSSRKVFDRQSTYECPSFIPVTPTFTNT
ncbi:hypothetical protein F5880DRAFT_973016 [Lentinula raphanica]|nr:hypothetical protein F5880DRAFT_973016 [Lentinula raphanica]